MSTNETTFAENVPLSRYTTLGVGGPARYLVSVDTVALLQNAIRTCYNHRLPFLILGKGSNSLFDDKGFDGVIILNKISFLKQEGGRLYVGSGYSFSRLGMKTAREGWSGLEFAGGIPCSVGGAVYMNAGANGQETGDTLVEVEFVDDTGLLQLFSKNDLSFNYRSSSFHQMQGSIASATFLLHQSEQAKEKQSELLSYRKKTQPYSDKSAGCAFRNPPGYSAGALIDQCQLKGYSMGGAQVSTMHCNFIINANNATAKDVLALMQHIKEEVLKQKGVILEEEIRYIPYNRDRQD
ncbi:UDP-N-acetylmuramate dehydrogenase [Simkania negevensis]|uniref:UDP-N-acetylenolpyruvoylglucosamine reductase n=1 Tax=Simkania negevensis TaxID=83561 RepID=A0ABS3AVS9_9BACT|nr:UDP-N-acetylmuramate dehydrogenase [Simkania negevensis]